MEFYSLGRVSSREFSCFGYSSFQMLERIEEKETGREKREKETIPLSKSFAFFIAFSHFFVTRLISFEYIYAERGESLEYHIKQSSYSNRSSHYPLLQVAFNTFNFDVFIRSIFETRSEKLVSVDPLDMN